MTIFGPNGEIQAVNPNQVPKMPVVLSDVQFMTPMIMLGMCQGMTFEAALIQANTIVANLRCIDLARVQHDIYEDVKQTKEMQHEERKGNSGQSTN